MKNRMIVTVSCLFFLSGCVEKEILDDIGIEMARAYDWVDEDTIEGTSLVYNVQPDKSVENTTFSAEATTSRDLFNKLQRQSPDPLAEGSIEAFLFSKELALNGISDYLDAPQRNASIGERLYFATVNGKAKELLKGNFGRRGNAIYISTLLEHNMEHEEIPKTNMQLFFHDYYQLGKTPFLPELKKINDKVMEVSGLSLFKGKEMRIVDTIEVDKMFFFKLLTDKFSEGAHKIKMGNDEGVLRSIKSKNKMKIASQNPFVINIQIKITGVLKEYTGQRLTPMEIKEMEKILSEKVTKECEGLVKRFQEKKIDPVGFGFFIKTKKRGFDLNNWEDSERYQSLKVHVKAYVDIVESGVIE
ncbi:Ger(x)C family spore germination protein [Neobacillus sp. D3-1R]|uniref:Ger(x)C family spore germination protein n=1 Tax=Neobacillus sp. D3-1R TaxID=3445778 RepID=UPI003F9F11DF